MPVDDPRRERLHAVALRRRQNLGAVAAIGVRPGAYWAEGQIGTNAPALAAAEGHPVRVSGEEHVRRALHGWSFCATPVYDNSGRQRGSIALGCLLADCAAGDLSLTLAIAREIGNSLNADGLLAESNRHLNQLYGLLDGVDDGVMAWDHRGYLQYINQRAAGLLKLDEQQSQGKPLAQLLTLPALLKRAIADRQPLQRRSHLRKPAAVYRRLADAKPIFDGDRCSFIALLHPLERLRQYVSSQLGRVSHSFEQMPSASLEMRRLIRYGQQAARASINPAARRKGSKSGSARLSTTPANAPPGRISPSTASCCRRLGVA